MDWGVAAAKQQLSRLLKEARREPQVIRTRGELVAAVLGADDAAAYLAWRERRRPARGGLAALFDLGRAIATEEGIDLPTVVRVDRPNPMVPVKRKAARARRHQRHQ